ncbi:MAG: DUF4037 domain-containing protein [Sphaerochaetaceae bacterium]|nr:DUF4037 domain-containing protein [Sphaerochaetaceae bacterium]
MTGVIDKNRRFYEKYVEPLLHSRYSEYEGRIAVGIAGEGSDCFGYDDELSRDHDFGTGVCLWLTDEDMKAIGYQLSLDYNGLVDSEKRSYYTERLRERRGVMSIHDFYSNILQTDCDISSCSLTEQQWLTLDHSCLKTAVNGEVFRDDLGVFSSFRNYLLNYYPDSVWRTRISEALHLYASSLQVNYARCMSRSDIVSATLCRSKGLEAAMDLFFLLKMEYPPYYKWTYRALKDLDKDGEFSEKIMLLAKESIRPEAWESMKYNPNRLNYLDGVVSVSEEIASCLEQMLLECGLIKKCGRYMELHVDEVLHGGD